MGTRSSSACSFNPEPDVLAVRGGASSLDIIQVPAERSSSRSPRSRRRCIRVGRCGRLSRSKFRAATNLEHLDQWRRRVAARTHQPTDGSTVGRRRFRITGCHAAARPQFPSPQDRARLRLAPQRRLRRSPSGLAVGLRWVASGVEAWHLASRIAQARRVQSPRCSEGAVA